MKKGIILFAAVLLFVSLTQVAIAQPPPPGHSSTSNQSQGAPVGSGVMILLTLSAAYGAKKIYTARQEKDEN